jgi:osmotically-inducible protein OsmY
MFKKISLILTCLFIFSACGPTMLFTGIAGAGATLSKEKTVGGTVDDHSIWTKIKGSFLQHNKEVDGILTNISVEVSEGRVLLTGFVKTPEERLTILRLVWEQAGVREVINEIKLAEETNQSKVSQYSSDSWITTQVKSKMFMNNNVRSINFNVETIDSVVYILGIARTQEELDSITNIAENVKGVAKFVSYIRLNDKKPKEDFQDKKPQENGPSVEEKTNEEIVYPKSDTAAPEASKIDSEEEIEIEYLDSDD